jgi:hypothetical protein
MCFEKKEINDKIARPRCISHDVNCILGYLSVADQYRSSLGHLHSANLVMSLNASSCDLGQGPWLKIW